MHIQSNSITLWAPHVPVLFEYAFMYVLDICMYVRLWPTCGARWRLLCHICSYYYLFVIAKLLLVVTQCCKKISHLMTCWCLMYAVRCSVGWVVFVFASFSAMAFRKPTESHQPTTSRCNRQECFARIIGHYLIFINDTKVLSAVGLLLLLLLVLVYLLIFLYHRTWYSYRWVFVYIYVYIDQVCIEFTYFYMCTYVHTRIKTWI